MSNIPYDERINRKLTEDLTPLPIKEASKFFSALFAVSNMSALLRPTHAALDAAGNDDYARVINGVADLLIGLDNIYDLDRQLMLRLDAAHEIKDQIKKTIDQAKHKLRRSEGREKRTRGQYMIKDSIRYAREAYVCLSPMSLSPDDFHKYADKKAVAEYRLGSTGLISNIRSTKRKRKELFRTDGSLAEGKAGSTTSDPIDPETGLKYYEMIEAYQHPSRDPRTPAWTTDPFYKYHAMVWGRRRYAQIMREMHWRTCPFFLLPLEDFEGRGEYDYLELAEFDYLGVLDGIGGLNFRPDLNPHKRKHSCLRLPFYSLYGDVSNAEARFASNTTTFVIDNAHDTDNPAFADWKQKNTSGTTRYKLGLQICKEKERLGLLPLGTTDQILETAGTKEEINISDLIQNYTCIDQGRWLTRSEEMRKLNT